MNWYKYYVIRILCASHDLSLLLMSFLIAPKCTSYLDLSLCLSVYVYIFGSRSAAFSQCVPIIIIIVWYMMMEVFHAAFAGGAKEVTSPPPPSLQSSQSLRLGFLKLRNFKP